MSQATPAVSNKLFGLLCLASYLLSLSYGSTFLLSLLIAARGGNEHDAGHVISAAMLSTFVAVLACGHLSDLLGAARSIALFGLLLVAASLGFATTPGVGHWLLFFGLLLGLGWGVFYTLGPIIVASLVIPAQRAKYFALLSGSMMSGIGSGPLLGRAAGDGSVSSGGAGEPDRCAAVLAPRNEAERHAGHDSGKNHLACDHTSTEFARGFADHHGRTGRLCVRRSVQFPDELCRRAVAGLFAVLCGIHGRVDLQSNVDRRLRGQTRSAARVLPVVRLDAGLDCAAHFRCRQ